MKLITKINRNTLIISAIIFVAGNILFYFITRQIISEETNESLYASRQEVLKHINDLDTIPHYYTSTGERVEIVPVTLQKEEELRDTFIYDKYEQKELPYRELTFYTSLDEKILKVTLRKSLLESDELLEGISTAMLALTLALFTLLYFLNYRTIQNSWKPFYQTLDKLRAFNLSSNQQLQLTQASIQEFSELNNVITKMAERIREDYVKMKEFTENTSHELQTSLAIIQSRMELLLQDEKLGKEQAELIQSAYESVARLSKLNKGLLLLARIGNNQFYPSEPVRLDELINEKLDYFSDWIIEKKLTIEKEIAVTTVKLNPQLAEIFVSNLITNAIRHNLKRGKISIQLSPAALTISNTGVEPHVPPAELFQRFSTSSAEAGSTGLGLAIIKQVCDLHGYNITYSYSNGMHIISIRF